MIDHALFTAICLVWGSSFIMMKYAATAFEPMQVAVGRLASGAATLLVCWLLLRRKEAWPFGWPDVGRLAVISALGYAFPWVLQVWLIREHGDSGFFAVLVALVPLLTAVVSVPLLGQYARPRQVAGVLVGLALLGLLFRDGLARAMPLQHLLLAASVPTCYAVANTLIKRWFSAAPPIALAMMPMVIGGLALVVPMSMGPEVQAGPKLMPAAVAVLLLGVLGSGAAMLMFYRLIQRRGPLFGGMVTYVIPVVALGWAWLDGERLTRLQLLCLLGILFSVALVQWPAKKPPTDARAVGTGEQPAA